MEIRTVPIWVLSPLHDKSTWDPFSLRRVKNQARFVVLRHNRCIESVVYYFFDVANIHKNSKVLRHSLYMHACVISVGDGWINVWMDGWMDRWMGRRVVGWLALTMFIYRLSTVISSTTTTLIYSNRFIVRYSVNSYWCDTYHAVRIHSYLFESVS